MLTPPQKLAENLRNVRARIAAASRAAGRTEDSVTLLAVSKGQSTALIEAAAALGQRDFGENYLQEALPKIGALRSAELTWHFIGRVQANKTRAIAEHFAWVHTVDRPRILERLAAQRPYYAPPLQICLQVRLAPEVAKGGVEPAELAELAAAARDLPRLRLRGLMCIPPAEPTADRQRHWFERLAALAEQLRASGFTLDTLSMGMSADLEAAIAAGSTIVRVGTAIFGPRN
ncbi:MAG: YggS family pyridoxal phosphate-dependent enzyme [Steroidobacteraceae bacterium]|nr:YggS family pyridoxal phosphate-dependent enzyme [Steroidobacteraceae bacterium]MDW8259276.1 YggS family pyridoxal phosphate-dependent enzyme [Gammaproteobacteria bacterium]